MGKEHLYNTGVWGHSAPNETYIIFSIDEQETDAMRSLFATELAKLDINYKPIQGCYKGIMEHSFIINGKDWQKLSCKLGDYIENQESILILGDMDSRDRRKATLLYLNTMKLEDLGRLQSVSKKEALEHDAWSYDATQDKYFITYIN